MGANSKLAVSVFLDSCGDNIKDGSSNANSSINIKTENNLIEFYGKVINNKTIRRPTPFGLSRRRGNSSVSFNSNVNSAPNSYSSSISVKAKIKSKIFYPKSSVSTSINITTEAEKE